MCFRAKRPLDAPSLCTCGAALATFAIRGPKARHPDQLQRRAEAVGGRRRLAAPTLGSERSASAEYAATTATAAAAAAATSIAAARTVLVWGGPHALVCSAPLRQCPPRLCVSIRLAKLILIAASAPTSARAMRPRDGELRHPPRRQQRPPLPRSRRQNLRLRVRPPASPPVPGLLRICLP